MPDSDKLLLRRVNKQFAWFAPGFQLAWLVEDATGEITVPENKHYKKVPEGFSLVFEAVPDETMRFIQTMFKHTRVGVPNLRNTGTMLMQGTIASREDSVDSNHFDYWLNVSTLFSGVPVQVPIKSNSYFEERKNAADKWCAPIQVQVDSNGGVTFGFILQESFSVQPGSEHIGMDSNFSDNLFSFSDGQLVGKKFVDWVKKLDKQIVERLKELQRAKIKPSTDKEYNSLIKRLRDHTKNEIGRLVNKAVREKNTGSLSVEKLNFRGGGLSKRMNRLITMMGRSALSKKLARIEESHKVKVFRLNPAYSSLECSNCSYTDEANRKGRKFHCQCCNLSIHADINSARVLRKRRSLSNSDPFANVSKNKVYDKIMSTHTAHCRTHTAFTSRVAGSGKGSSPTQR